MAKTMDNWDSQGQNWHNRRGTLEENSNGLKNQAGRNVKIHLKQFQRGNLKDCNKARYINPERVSSPKKLQVEY